MLFKEYDPMPKRRRSSALFSGMDIWSLGIDASAVIGLRMLKLARGGSAASAEAVLMMREKIDAAAEMQLAFLTGDLGTTPTAVSRSVIDRYATKVRANRKRPS